MVATDNAQLHHLRFCLELHRAVASDGGDSCFSPYSVASALGLLSRASAGPASDELVGLLAGTDSDIEKQAELLGRASELVARSDLQAPVLTVSNTLWAWDELPLNADFLDELTGWPGNRVASAPFVDDPAAARRTINADVSAATEGLVPELLAPGSVDRDTVAALVNALYLRVAWIHPFREAHTELAGFHAPDGICQVATMRQSQTLGYASADGWQFVALPAVGGVEAVVLLPDGDLAERESTLDEAMLAGLFESARRRPVDLTLPKVRLDVRSPLTDVLQSLGVTTVFLPAADFSPLTEDPRLAVSSVEHQAVLRVDEQGLEGAAATAAMMTLTSMTPAEPVRLAVDRPFLLLVRHAETGVVYFFSRVVDP